MGSCAQKVGEEKKSAEQGRMLSVTSSNVIGLNSSEHQAGNILRTKLNKVKKGGKFNKREWIIALDEWTKNETDKILAAEYTFRSSNRVQGAIDIQRSFAALKPESAQRKKRKSYFEKYPLSRKYRYSFDPVARKMKDYKRQVEKLEKPINPNNQRASSWSIPSAPSKASAIWCTRVSNRLPILCGRWRRNMRKRARSKSPAGPLRESMRKGFAAGSHPVRPDGTESPGHARRPGYR